GPLAAPFRVPRRRPGLRAGAGRGRGALCDRHRAVLVLADGSAAPVLGAPAQRQRRGPEAAVTIHLRNRLLMKNIFLAAALAALALPAAAQAPLASPASSGKFGFVHTERILRDSVPAMRA